MHATAREKINGIIGFNLSFIFSFFVVDFYPWLPFSSLHKFKEKLRILPLIPKLIGVPFDKVPNENGATTTAGVVVIDAGFKLLLASTVFL